MLLKLWQGLGDSVYLRPVVRAAAVAGEDVWLKTPWPQLFEDLDVRFVEPEPTYRTQRSNVARLERFWVSDPPADLREVMPKIVPGGSISGGISEWSPWKIDPDVFDLPSFSQYLKRWPSNIAVVRPVTVRREWENVSRNPAVEYVNRAARTLMDGGYYVIVVADTKRGEEWLADGPSPPNHCWLEPEITETLCLIENAAVVVGGVGFILPTSVAYKTPVITICGGNGGHNAPERLIGYGMDGSKARWIVPDDYCRCLSYDHECSKEISDFDNQFTAALKDLT